MPVISGLSQRPSINVIPPPPTEDAADTIECDGFAILSASILNYSIVRSNGVEQVQQFLAQQGVPADQMPDIITDYSVAGWDSSDYVNALPALIDRMQQYDSPLVLVHGFGNDISPGGGWPGNAEQYNSQMRLIVNTLNDAGIRVMVSSVSYRIPPGSNPSAPYNLHINEPIARELAPWCWDDDADRPRYDLYEFTRHTDPGFFDADNIHPNEAGRQRVRGYTAEVLSRLILGKREPLRGLDFFGRTFVFSFGDDVENFDGINAVISNDNGGSASTGSQGAARGYNFVATDGTSIKGPMVEAGFFTNVNTAGLNPGSSATSVENGRSLSTSIFANVDDVNDTGLIPFVEWTGLPNGLTGTLTISGSREADDSRPGRYRVTSGSPYDRGDKILDGTANPPETLSWPITVNEGKVRLEFQPETDDDRFAYLGVAALSFDAAFFQPIVSDYRAAGADDILAGNQGAVFDMMDMSRVFQDEAGEVPVRYYGDPVARINSDQDGVYLRSNRGAATIEQVNGEPVIRVRDNRFLLEGMDVRYARPNIAHRTFDANRCVACWFARAGGGYGNRRWGSFLQSGQYRVFHNVGDISPVSNVESWAEWHSIVLNRSTDTAIADGQSFSITTGDETYADDDAGFAVGGYPEDNGDAMNGIMTYFAIADGGLDADALAALDDRQRTAMNLEG